MSRMDIEPSAIQHILITHQDTDHVVGAGLSFLILGERLTILYFAVFVVMILGTVLVIRDTLIRHHMHEYEHLITHIHDGMTHTHVVSHSHKHNHMLSDERHGHHHSKEELLPALKEVHQT